MSAYQDQGRRYYLPLGRGTFEEALAAASRTNNKGIRLVQQEHASYAFLHFSDDKLDYNTEL